jgi:putative nucleotidyltransferase with HDIG domain
MAITGIAEQIKSIVLGRIAADRLVVPAMPQAAQRALTLLKEPDFDIKQVAQVLARDPVLASQVLRVANSAAYAAGGTVASIDQASTRLGASKLRTLVIDVSARPLFESRDRRIAESCRGIWDHSLAVALLSRDVAALCGDTAPDTAYLAGLLHDIGKPLVAGMLLEAEKSIAGSTKRSTWLDPQTWMEAVQSCHREVAITLAGKWNLPEPVARGIADCNEYDAEERLCTPNFVRFANAVTKQLGLYVGPTDPDDVDAMVMIGRSMLNIEDSVLTSLSQGLKERVKSQAA